MTKRETAIAFLTLAGSGGAIEAFSLYVAEGFVHHNQYFEGSRASIMNAMADAHKTSPNISLDIKHTYADGDNIITHSHVVKADMEIAVVHIFRFVNGEIAELWDLGQIMLDDSPNGNGLF